MRYNRLSVNFAAAFYLALLELLMCFPGPVRYDDVMEGSSSANEITGSAVNSNLHRHLRQYYAANVRTFTPYTTPSPGFLGDSCKRDLDCIIPNSVCFTVTNVYEGVCQCKDSHKPRAGDCILLDDLISQLAKAGSLPLVNGAFGVALTPGLSDADPAASHRLMKLIFQGLENLGSTVTGMNIHDLVATHGAVQNALNYQNAQIPNSHPNPNGMGHAQPQPQHQNLAMLPDSMPPTQRPLPPLPRLNVLTFPPPSRIATPSPIVSSEPNATVPPWLFWLHMEPTPSTATPPTTLRLTTRIHTTPFVRTPFYHLATTPYPITSKPKRDFQLEFLKELTIQSKEDSGRFPEFKPKEPDIAAALKNRTSILPKKGSIIFGIESNENASCTSGTTSSTTVPTTSTTTSTTTPTTTTTTTTTTSTTSTATTTTTTTPLTTTTIFSFERKTNERQSPRGSLFGRGPSFTQISLRGTGPSRFNRTAGLAGSIPSSRVNEEDDRDEPPADGEAGGNERTIMIKLTPSELEKIVQKSVDRAMRLYFQNAPVAPKPTATAHSRSYLHPFEFLTTRTPDSTGGPSKPPLFLPHYSNLPRIVVQPRRNHG